MKKTINFAKNAITLLLTTLFIISCNDEKISTTELDPAEIVTVMGVKVEMRNKILSFESEAELTNLLRVIENKQPILTRHLNDGVSIHIKDKSWKIEGFESLYDVYLDAMNKAESYYEREGGYEEFKEKYSSLYFPEHGTDYSAYLPVSNDYIAKLVNRNGDLYIDNTIVNYKDINSYSQLEDLGLTYPETDESNLTDTKGVEINGYFYINLILL